MDFLITKFYFIRNVFVILAIGLDIHNRVNCWP